MGYIGIWREFGKGFQIVIKADQRFSATHNPYHRFILPSQSSVLIRVIEPLIVGWGWNPDPSKIQGSPFFSYLQWTGTKDPAAALSVPAAIQFAAEHNWEIVRQQCHALLCQTIQRICELTGLPPLYPLASDFYRQMGLAPLPPDVDLEAWRRRLLADYRIEIPVIEWNGQKFLRLSVQGYNTPEDLEALVKAVKALL